jgi:hypothetical protein
LPTEKYPLVSKDKSQSSAEEFFPARKSLKAFREAPPTARLVTCGNAARKPFSAMVLAGLKYYSSGTTR